ncbi:vicilin-like seed storage protein At4g36700 [Silene latifolia]|uniref:vicilin-like seed storage protein At4g36700 n=1 Tax=Silene latifolia TaxID=37657 RepID=UPI003D77C9D6
MSKTSRVMAVLSYLVIFIICLELPVNIVSGRVKNEVSGPAAQVVKKDERTTVFESEFGSISTVDIDDGTEKNKYHLQFINMEPNALFLPVLLHADMVFYVRSGNGILSWTEDDKINKVNLQRGDLYRLQSGTLFYLNSNNTNTFWSVTPSLRIVAIFDDPDEEQLQSPSVGPYSTINELVRGFDDPVLQSAFQVPEQVIQELTNTSDTAVIVSADQQSKEEEDEEFPFVKAMFGIQRLSMRASENKKKKHTKTFNFFKEEPDFENCNGWGKFVSKHDLRALRDSQIGVYMVNLTTGSMVGPHWNPYANEVSVVLEGEGMVQVVCASSLTNKDCKNTRVRVEEGDVFTVPRFHPVAQMSFNSDSLVFMGFSSISKKDKPQFLVGKASFLQKLDKGILGVAFNVSNTTIGQLISVRKKSILQDCTSCAEEQEGISEEEKGTGRRGEGEREAEEEKERKGEGEGEGEGEPGARRQEEERREREEEGGRSEKESKEERGRREETEEEEERQTEEEKQERREEERRERQEEGGRSEEGSKEEMGRREETEEEKERQREKERREEAERRERRQEEGGRSEEGSKEEMGRREETGEEEERQREQERRERRQESERHEEESEEDMGRREEIEEVERQGEEDEAGRGWL